MIKKQFVLILGGIVIIVLLFFFGRTTDKSPKNVVSASANTPKKFDIQQFIDSAEQNLTSQQSIYISKLENSISRGDVQSQQMQAYRSLASFWRDSARNFEIYAYYTSEAAKLDNSEKNLTFAGQLILDILRVERDEAKLDWETDVAADLFQRVLKLEPDNDEAKIGLGSVYIFGKGRSGDPAETMKGIQQVLSVVRKDSNNLKAQLVLGVGGFISGQYDKAIERFLKVIAQEPDNLEAVAFLADTYAAKGNKEEAVKWYTVSKRLANNAHYSAEVDERIRGLK